MQRLEGAAPLGDATLVGLADGLLRHPAAAVKQGGVHILEVLRDDPMLRERLAALGVRRISVGGSLARTAWAGMPCVMSMISTSGAIRFITP